MSDSSTSSALELLVTLDRGSRTPLRAQLEGGLRESIRSGRLPAGTRLPSTRAMARDLGVTRGLVVDAFAQLQAEGYLSTRPGSSTVVAARAAPSERTGGESPPEARRLPRWDFYPGAPDLRSFPRRDWLAAERRVLLAVPDAALSYGDPAGEPDLRTVLASYLGRVRGCHVAPSDIVVCAGFAQSRSVLLRVLRSQGAGRIALEDPGQPESFQAVRRAGLAPVPIPVDADGIRVDLLRRSDPDAVLVTPAHQFPIGAVLAPNRRRDLLAWARDNRRLVVEDDYDAEFRYDREPVGALQGLAPDRVAYAGSVSKSLAPALRIGWLCCPPGLAGSVIDAKRGEDLGGPVLAQRTLADLIESGRFDRHLRRVRRIYRSRRDALAAEIRQVAPDITLTGIAAGLHVVARLPTGADDSRIAEVARRRLVGLYPLSGYAQHADSGAALVLGYGDLTESAIHEGIRRIADLLTA